VRVERLSLRIRVSVFALTWLSYASYYLTRKNFSVAKPAVMDTFAIAKQELAHIDTAYLAAYAIGQFTWGFVADRVGPRRVIGIGMLATAACSVAFGLSGTFWGFATAWFVNGIAQGSGWSPNVKAMTTIPPPDKRGLVMGFWTTNYVVGGLVATPFAAWALARSGILGAFAHPAIVVATVGLAILIFLPDTGVHSLAVGPGADERRAARRAVLHSTRVWILGASYFFMKLTRYALLFWLPFYGVKALGYSTGKAALVSLAFELGGVAGAVSIGFLSDRLLGGRRFPIGIASLVGLAVALSLYGAASQHGVVANVACLAAIGFFLFGPDAILSGAAAQDLGGPAAAAAAAGIINGMGSVGPIFGSEMWTAYSTSHGWNAAFQLLGIGAIASALILVPLWRVGAHTTRASAA
jgi:sugar phosphate permease